MIMQRYASKTTEKKRVAKYNTVCTSNVLATERNTCYALQLSYHGPFNICRRGRGLHANEEGRERMVLVLNVDNVHFPIYDASQIIDTPVHRRLPLARCRGPRRRRRRVNVERHRGFGGLNDPALREEPGHRVAVQMVHIAP